MDAIKEERRKSARWRLPQAFTQSPAPPPRLPPGDISSDSDTTDAESESDGDNQDASIDCEDDRCRGPAPPIWHCVDCDSSYCSECWPLQGPHKPKKKGRDGMPHEKTNPNVVRRLKGILNPPRTPAAINRLHEDDESTKWFGVSRDGTGRPSFEDYGRYASLMATISPVESMANRYPQLVSFIGVTNAGKSTLIRLLIESSEGDNRNSEGGAMFPSPVVGSVVNDSLPTSGDVHLYADPSTHTEQLPLMFADCEGFEGGEQTPMGARSRLRGGQGGHEGAKDSGNVLTRSIEWANDDVSRQREFAVTALYPRLLYTFSDCVVFVLRNPKTFQSSVLTKLLEWGVAALEKSLNQPALPHCVVAVNGCDPSVPEEEWDVTYATNSLLSSVSGALDEQEGVPRFRELAEYWRGLGKHIETVEDLILRYYSTFKVVRIPAKPRYMTINEQIGKLHTVIRNNCEQSFRTKRRARMLTNADELNTYLQSGFDHFCTHLNIPFNFMQVSLLRNPIPNDFGGHILQLCTTISSQQPKQAGRANWLFEKLSVMLASCVLLDCARFRKGRVDELFGNYEKFFDYALSEFTEVHWPCEFVENATGRRCMLVKARHLTKGHQDERGIIAAGEYQAAFDTSFLPEWKQQLRAAIADIQRDFSYELEQASYNDDVHAVPEERIALDLHIEYLNQFFENVGPAAAICSHATCFSCLMDVPEHPLQCGHVLCSACVKAYGIPRKSSVVMACCPLHRDATKWAKPTVVRFKPPHAGVRVLSLDGGGIRGIVQLEVLRAIEGALGAFLPIQSFFDLIVGSGTGGLLAIALQTHDRTVDACIDMFNAVCDHAFMPRLRGVPILNNLAAAIGSGPKYKTKQLHSALKTAFSEDEDLFGASSSVSTKLRPGARVAMTSTSVTGRESMLLASYRRPEDVTPSYKFERPNEPEMELKMWQAVAGSMATPSYFKPLTFHGQIYQDGGLLCTNPSFIADHERRLIWPDVAEPDLFLSLGTGQNRISVLSKMPDKPQSSSASIISQPSGKQNRYGWWRSRRVDDIVDAEIAWSEFRAQSQHEKNEARRRRYVRFNPDLDKEPPSQDSKSEIENLQVSVRKRLQTPHRMAALKNVANRLIASSFYLEVQSKATAEKTEQVCATVISCRFEDGSEEMRALGQIIEQRRTLDFEPYILIKPDQDSTEAAFKIPLSKEVCKAMIDSAVFGLANIYIPLRDETKASSINLFLSAHDGLEPHGFPISGFPRMLLGEPSPAAAAATARRVKQLNDSMRPTSPSTVRAVTPTDDDVISISGRLAPKSSNSELGRRTSTQFKPSPSGSSGSTTPRPSLADILAQHNPGQGTSIQGRTNRFWTYIGNTHMAQHPEKYSAEELAKFASSVDINVKDVVAPQLNGERRSPQTERSISPRTEREPSRPESKDSTVTSRQEQLPSTALPPMQSPKRKPTPQQQQQQEQHQEAHQQQSQQQSSSQLPLRTSSLAGMQKVYQANEKLRGLTIQPTQYNSNLRAHQTPPLQSYQFNNNSRPASSNNSNLNPNTPNTNPTPSPATPGIYEDARESQFQPLPLQYNQQHSQKPQQATYPHHHHQRHKRNKSSSGISSLGDEDEINSVYSGQEAIAQASPVVQFQPTPETKPQQQQQPHYRTSPPTSSSGHHPKPQPQPQAQPQQSTHESYQLPSFSSPLLPKPLMLQPVQYSPDSKPGGGKVGNGISRNDERDKEAGRLGSGGGGSGGDGKSGERDATTVEDGIEKSVASSLRPKSSTVRDLEQWLSTQRAGRKLIKKTPPPPPTTAAVSQPAPSQTQPAYHSQYQHQYQQYRYQQQQQPPQLPPLSTHESEDPKARESASTSSLRRGSGSLSPPQRAGSPGSGAWSAGRGRGVGQGLGRGKGKGKGKSEGKGGLMAVREDCGE